MPSLVMAEIRDAHALVRRNEFGLLVHLGFTRQQVLAVVAGEGAAWTAIGALAGLALGLAVSVVLVHVVNPQSFHWTMDLLVPWGRLALLCAAVVAAGTVTAWLAARGRGARCGVGGEGGLVRDDGRGRSSPVRQPSPKMRSAAPDANLKWGRCCGATSRPRERVLKTRWIHNKRLHMKD